MSRFRTCLWFDRQAEEAANFYASVFDDARISQVHRAPDGGTLPAGHALTVVLELGDQQYLFLNGGPHFTLDEAVSIVVECRDQAEIDRLWRALAADGGSTSHCGWLKDRFGVSWQIVPAVLPRLLADPDRAGRVLMALMGMSKLDIRKLETA